MGMQKLHVAQVHCRREAMLRLRDRMCSWHQLLFNAG